MHACVDQNDFYRSKITSCLFPISCGKGNSASGGSSSAIGGYMNQVLGDYSSVTGKLTKHRVCLDLHENLAARFSIICFMCQVEKRTMQVASILPLVEEKIITQMVTAHL